MPLLKKIAKISVLILLVLSILVFWLAQKPKPESIQYGMSFNALYANELGLDVKTVYDAFLHDLGVRHLRLAAHWPLVEPEPGVYDFSDLDYQVEEAEKVGAEIIMSVGKRLPRWPECHVPEWAEELNVADQQSEVLDLVEKVVVRYKDSPAITYWQVENEPFLEVFAFEHCGELNKSFLEEEIKLVKELDGTRPVLVTDSGNLGTWYGAYRRGDAFGTSVYVHFWTPELGQFRTVLPPWFYRVKENLISLIFGDKETILIELSAEPWLIEPVTDVDIETQYTRMDINKFNDILDYAEKTRYEKQYLWGGEWWYWLNEQGHPEMWEKGEELFGGNG